MCGPCSLRKRHWLCNEKADLHLTPARNLGVKGVKVLALNASAHVYGSSMSTNTGDTNTLQLGNKSYNGLGKETRLRFFLSFFKFKK